jgi:hypothetical protein
MDLWIFNPADKEMVQAKKFSIDNSVNNEARNPFTPVIGEITLKQKENVKETKNLIGYNIYYAYESDPFAYLDASTDTTYSHQEAGWINGLHIYYVTANYFEGESSPSNIATAVISGNSEAEIEKIQIFPNPVWDIVRIVSYEDILNIIIINSKGQIVYRNSEIGESQIEVNLENLPVGIFQIRIETGNRWLNKKIIKK